CIPIVLAKVDVSYKMRFQTAEGGLANLFRRCALMPNRSFTDETHARRDLLRGATLAAAGGLLFDRIVKADDASAKGAERRALHPEGAPAADIGYSPAILAQGQRVLFISGQGPKDRKAEM